MDIIIELLFKNTWKELYTRQRFVEKMIPINSYTINEWGAKKEHFQVVWYVWRTRKRKILSVTIKIWKTMIQFWRGKKNPL